MSPEIGPKSFGGFERTPGVEQPFLSKETFKLLSHTDFQTKTFKILVNLARQLQRDLRRFICLALPVSL